MDYRILSWDDGGKLLSIHVDSFTNVTIGIWRRFLFMKKGINKSILFYIASVLFFIASAIGFTSGNESSMAIVWLCLGSSFLCLGSTHKKKENNTDDK